MADQLITGTTLIEDKRSEKGEVWSCSGYAFIASDMNTPAQFTYTGGKLNYDTAGGAAVAPVTGIPNGAKILGVVVYGLDAVETWTLSRVLIAAGTTEAMATANINTEDTSISAETINNNDYAYHLDTSALDATDEIYGARIRYEF